MTMMTSDTQLRRVELAPAVALFRSLADPARLAIVRRLAAGEARVVDLVGEIGLAQATVSAHLACLRDCGWWPRARWAGRRCSGLPARSWGSY